MGSLAPSIPTHSMLRRVRLRPPVLTALAALALAGCGDSGPSDEAQIRGALEEFQRATAAKDYAALCDRVLAPKLIETVEQIGLPCETALEKGFESVRDPRISVGAVTVDGDSATAQVRSSAAGQEPSEDTVRLVRVGRRLADRLPGRGSGSLGTRPGTGALRDGDGLGGPPMPGPPARREGCGHEPENPHPSPARGRRPRAGPRRPRRRPGPPRSPGRATPSTTRPRPARPTRPVRGTASSTSRRSRSATATGSPSPTTPAATARPSPTASSATCRRR